MLDPEPDKQLSMLGYTIAWLEYGLLTQELLSDQVNTFCKSDDKNTEHYRYTAFRNYLAAKDSLTDKEFANYSELALSDTDRVMAGTALIDLFTKAHLSDEKFEKLITCLKELGDWTQQTITRQRLLRKLKQEKLTDELFGVCLEQGDSVVQEYLTAIADHEQMNVLALKGKTKKIRNMASHYLNK